MNPRRKAKKSTVIIIGEAVARAFIPPGREIRSACKVISGHDSEEEEGTCWHQISQVLMPCPQRLRCLLMNYQGIGRDGYYLKKNEHGN